MGEITESERQFRLMADAAPVMIWTADADARCDYFNAPWLAFTGRTLAEELGDGWLAGVHPHDRPRCMETYLAHFHARQPFSMEYRLRHADGGWRWVLDNGVPRSAPDGTFLGYCGSCTDITRLKDTAETVTAERQAAMGELLGNVAHQWRQPLNALALVLANLEDAARFDELDRGVVERAVADGQALIQKMSATINVFRDAFHTRGEKTTFSAQALVQETVALVDAGFQRDRVQLDVKVSNDALIHANRTEYAQVLLNLLSNAKQAILGAHRLAGHITVSFDTRGAFGCLSVRDDGGGIPAEVLDRIFEPYFSTRVGNIGLGLYTSRQLVERGMGGRLEAHNVEGGAELLVFTPLLPDATQPTAPA